MKKSVLMVVAVLVLAGCQNRAIWDDNGKVENATEGREIWNDHGKMEAGERKIWVRQDGEEVIK
ncbi:hypothetical protein LCGC14_0803170 [marine sediment metagenome]|uniref:Lipoprotein n=2 Tax=root TaxID=1 RepID=A0A0F9SWA1_9ZZZZ|nr:lipoprotein [Marinobacter antarcticus]HEA53041.1 hypothetical protein [Marinobacter antarcticus]